MSVPRIHFDATLTAGAELSLPEGPARHVAAVLRLREGAALTLFDGRGQEAAAVLVEVTRKRVVARIEAVEAGRGESPLAVHLGQAISKGDRMDYALQKATELGVAAITPLYTEHGDVRLKGEREAKKLAHWQGVASSACEQSGRATVPTAPAPPAAAARRVAGQPRRSVAAGASPGHRLALVRSRDHRACRAADWPRRRPVPRRSRRRHGGRLHPADPRPAHSAHRNCPRSRVDAVAVLFWGFGVRGRPPLTIAGG